MLNIKVNNKDVYEVHIKDQTVSLNNHPVQFNHIQTGENKYHVLYKNHSYSVEIGEKTEKGKVQTVWINHVKHEVEVFDHFDALLKQLGMDKLAGQKVNEAKAPMPGLVLKVMVEEGQAVKKGDTLLVLEAMKMENSIKASSDGVVKKVNAKEKTAVDKGQVLVVFE